MGVVVRPVSPGFGPVRFRTEMPSKPVVLMKSYAMILRRRWARCPRTTEGDLIMGFTLTPQEPKRSSAPAEVAVSDEVAKDLAGLWDYIAEHPGYTGHAKFDKADEIEGFVAQATSWARKQTVANADGDKGPLTFRKLPGELPATEIRFSLNAVPTKAEVAAREAKKKARAEAKAKADSEKAAAK